MAAVAGCDAFPGTKFVCFDPSWRMTIPVLQRESGPRATFIMESQVRTMKHLSIDMLESTLRQRDIAFLTDHAGTFSDSTCASMLALHSRMRDYELVFVSDVRSTTRQTPAQKETAIALDMASQAGWVKRLRVCYYSLKLRLPFLITPEIYKQYSDTCHAYGDKSQVQKIIDNAKCAKKLPYLSGRCVLQKFARNTSTEMRLMGFNKPSMVWYDIEDIETKFFPFNTVHRGNTRFAVNPLSGPMDMIMHDVMHYSSGIASRQSHASFDELGEAVVLGEAACVGSALCHATHYRPSIEKSPAKLFVKLVNGFASLFVGSRRCSRA